MIISNKFKGSFAACVAAMGMMAVAGPSATADWGRTEIQNAQVEGDGTVTLTVPATAEKGFMILRSKGK